MAASSDQRSVRARFRDAEARVQLLRITPKQARQLANLAGKGPAPAVAVDATTGTITAFLERTPPSLERLLERFRLVVDPASFVPFVPESWAELIEKWTEPDERARRLLLYGPEGTGKDTLLRLLIEKLKQIHGPQNTEILTLPPEEPDRYVGHLETKSRDLMAAVGLAKDAEKTVIVYLPEIERYFAVGEIVPTWHLQWTATLREILDGTRRLRADYVLGSTNNLARLGGPVVSRFEKQHIGMTLELAEGILLAHWPSQEANGLSPAYLLDRLYREPIAQATLASRKKTALKATDLTGFNGRFLADLAADLGQTIRMRQRRDPEFFADEAFADEILAAHVQAILAPVSEAAGTRAIREFLVVPPDPLDPPVAVHPTLDGFMANKFVAC